jgi:hypothetical protein
MPIASRQLTEAQLAPVLEPLCQATETLFQPLQLNAYDHLLVSLDDKGEQFICRATALRAIEDGVELNDRHTVVRGGVVVPLDKATEDDKAYEGYGAISGNASTAWARRCPERKELGYGLWRVAVTDFSALAISSVWPAERIIFEDDNAQVQYSYLLLRFQSQSKAAYLVASHQEWYEDPADLDEQGQPKRKMRYRDPIMPPDFQDRPEADRKLAAYQKVALLTSLQQEMKAFFMEQGTGKTPVTVARVNLEGKRKREGRLPGTKPGMYRCLVICPQQLRSNWESEFARFSVHDGKVAVLRGGQVDRVKALYDGIRPAV